MSSLSSASWLFLRNDLADLSLSLTIAEYFRDEEGQDVLLFIDNIFRFTQGELVGLF